MHYILKKYLFLVKIGVTIGKGKKLIFQFYVSVRFKYVCSYNFVKFYL